MRRNYKVLSWKYRGKRPCYCHTCQEGFYLLEIIRHRRQHRNAKQNCTLSYFDGTTVFYNYNNPNKEITNDMLLQQNLKLSDKQT